MERDACQRPEKGAVTIISVLACDMTNVDEVPKVMHYFLALYI